MNQWSWLAWAIPLAVSALNLILTSKLVSLKSDILAEIRKEFEPRESCALKHTSIDQQLLRIEQALTSKSR